MMQTLWQLVLLAFTSGVALWIGLDVMRDVQDGAISWIVVPFDWTVRGKNLGGTQWFGRYERPFTYWFLLVSKTIALIGMAALAVVAGYSLLQP